jgi:hypothetical protein
MDPKTYEINNLRILNDYLTQTCELLARAQRINQTGTMGLSHSTFGPNVFGVPVQGMDPRAVDFNNIGLSHSPYGVPYTYGQSLPVWPGAEVGRLPTFVDPFATQRGLSHTPWTGWSPYAAAEIARQREMQSIIARLQYEAACLRPFGV